MKPLILFVLCICVVQPSLSQEPVPYPPPPSDIPAVVTMVKADEPGEKLIIDGIVYGEDGRTPLPGKDPDWIDEFLFDGDLFLSDKDRERVKVEGSFSTVMTVTRDQNGILRCRRDIIIPASGE